MFNIYRNGALVGRIPKSGTYQTFDFNGDNTIPKIPGDMKYRIGIQNGKKIIISVRTVNNYDLESEESKIDITPSTR